MLKQGCQEGMVKNRCRIISINRLKKESRRNGGDDDEMIALRAALIMLSMAGSHIQLKNHGCNATTDTGSNGR